MRDGSLWTCGPIYETTNRSTLFTWIDWSSQKFNTHELNNETYLAVSITAWFSHAMPLKVRSHQDMLKATCASRWHDRCNHPSGPLNNGFMSFAYLVWWIGTCKQGESRIWDINFCSMTDQTTLSQHHLLCRFIWKIKSIIAKCAIWV